jgi:hypothetical protein
MENFDLEKFKNYVNTYDKQLGHEGYSVKTIIDDFLYGIGICLDDSEFSLADGYERFKKMLLEHLDAVPREKALGPNKCYCGNPVDEDNPDCATYKLCKDHASDC